MCILLRFFLDNIINIRYTDHCDVAICVHGVLQLGAVMTVGDGNIIYVCNHMRFCIVQILNNIENYNVRYFDSFTITI